MQWTSVAPVVLASFMASMVEFVEALTIVLAVGLVRGWRSALLGTAASLATLAVLVLALGPLLAQIPLRSVQLVVGTLLLLFGLRWLRKAILRAAGVVAFHDETQAFAEETQALRRHGDAGKNEAIDKIAFATSYKIVMLEGIEVVFIVIAIGAGGRLLLPAAIGALLALIVVVLLGLWLHKPLAKVPENALKFGVGVMLAAFGTFWVGEGVGIAWPGADWALVVLIAAFLLVAAVLVRRCRQLQAMPREVEPNPKVAIASPRPSALASAWRELAGMFVDDGPLALGVVAWAALAWAAGFIEALPLGWVAGFIFAGGLAALLSISALRRAASR